MRSTSCRISVQSRIKPVTEETPSVITNPIRAAISSRPIWIFTMKNSLQSKNQCIHSGNEYQKYALINGNYSVMVAPYSTGLHRRV